MYGSTICLMVVLVAESEDTVAALRVVVVPAWEQQGSC